MKLLINIDVPALAPAIAFYESAVGLKFSRYLDEDVAELVGASSTLYLLQNDAATPANASAARTYARHWTPIHLDFVVDDIDAAVTRAVDAGAKRESECVEWRGSKCVSFSDPFGHGFCLIELSGDSYR